MEHSFEKGKKTLVKVSISGPSSWRLLQVSDATTGEVLVEKKFYKADFDQVMRDPQYKPFTDKLIDEAYTVKSAPPASSGESPDDDDLGDEEAA
jgi:hypothetical protein